MRVDVFVVEQACPYRELDGADFEASHLRAIVGDRLAGALRLFPGHHGGPARIGRVVVAPAFRGRGLAHRLMKEALAACSRRGDATVVLAAQAHLEPFYAGLGFARTGALYSEDGIPHVDMRLALPKGC